MKNPIIIPKTKDIYITKDTRGIKEKMGMSILNMCINFGSIDIKINVTKDVASECTRDEKALKHKKRLKDLYEIRNNIEQRYYLNNLLQ